ncbi:EamA family transporter [Baekduia soli]|nr:EamA family transporter [Baekduia soli]
MGWLAYALMTVVLFAMWGFLGKLALKTATPVQASILFGVMSVIVGVAAVWLGQKTSSWAPSSIWLACLSGLAGGAGLITIYMAFDRGPASLVSPVVGSYPAIVAVLSVVFLSEKLSTLQFAGVAVTVTGVLLVGLG